MTNIAIQFNILVHGKRQEGKEMKAVVRQDLQDEGLSVPTDKGFLPPNNTKYPVLHSDDEHLLLKVCGETVKADSIDFDYN